MLMPGFPNGRFRSPFAAPTFIRKETFVTFYITIRICDDFEDEIVNNRAFEHANLIFAEPWALANEIMVNIMQNFKFDFLKNDL